ncbi:MAG TPA: hypothetical protein VJP86_06225 [Vicinamibacterales bacterium]|jgi:hypothetical protein|nr:hypothetical protein [Vicinamibacterales bacterium]
MRFCLLAAVMFATVAAAPRQDSAVSSPSVTDPPRVTTAPNGLAEPLPVSLERIRELLATPTPLQQSLEKRPTFKVQVEEERQMQELLASLHLEETVSPVPQGGIYNYETQRVMYQALGRPMMQPYAAFSGGELLTIAIENLLGKYLGWLAVDAVTAADRARAQAAAKAEVARAVAQYCEGLPERGAHVQLCTEPLKP